MIASQSSQWLCLTLNYSCESPNNVSIFPASDMVIGPRYGMKEGGRKSHSHK